MDGAILAWRRRVIIASTLVLLNAGVQTETWTLQKWAQRQDNGGWAASCVARLDDQLRDPWPLVTLVTSDFTPSHGRRAASPTSGNPCCS